MIGIGVTTFRRSHYLDEVLRMIRLYTPSPYKVHVAFDDENNRKGIAKQKNACLYNLRDCEYIFLFDDDCYPKLPDWTSFFITGHRVSGSHHFLYNKDNIHHIDSTSFYSDDVSVVSHKDSGGVFMFLTQKCLSIVGGFYDKYQVYGFEHIGYSTRIHKAGLTESLYPTLAGTEKRLHAYDYESDNVESTLTYDQKLHYKTINLPILEQDYSQIYRLIIY